MVISYQFVYSCLSYFLISHITKQNTLLLSTFAPPNNFFFLQKGKWLLGIVNKFFHLNFSHIFLSSIIIVSSINMFFSIIARNTLYPIVFTMFRDIFSCFSAPAFYVLKVSLIGWFSLIIVLASTTYFLLSICVCVSMCYMNNVVNSEKTFTEQMIRAKLLIFFLNRQIFHGCFNQEQ